MDTAVPAAPTNTAAPSVAEPAPLRVLADTIFARTSPYEGVGLRNHCTRLHLFATALMRHRGKAGPILAQTSVKYRDTNRSVRISELKDDTSRQYYFKINKTL